MVILISILSSLAIIPAAYMCYLPMRNQLRFSRRRLIRDCVILFIASAAALLAGEYLFGGLNDTIALLPFLCVFCLYYIYSTRASLSQNLGIFSAVCALMAIASELAFIVSELCFQQEALVDDNWISDLLRTGFAFLMAVLFYKPLGTNGSYLIDNLRTDWIWLCTIPISVGSFAILTISAPMIFRTNGELGMRVQVLALVLFVICLYLFHIRVFARICRVLMSEDQLKAQETVFRIQRKQFETMEHNLKESKIARHDIKHAMQLAKRLIRDGKIDELGRYIDVSIENMPAETLHQYCDDGIMNAVLNHITDSCDESEINFNLTVDIPVLEEHQSVDIANFLQNLSENAILGCETLPPQDRRFDLTIKVVHGDELFIVSTNTFNGDIRKGRDGYFSTRGEEGGQGLGIPSMQTIAAKYGGTLETSNTDTRFFVNARMKLTNEHIHM